MREILFKAKRIDNGEWVEGFLIKDLHEEEWYIGYLFGGGAHDTDVAQIDPDTLCQYTGLADKNGHKIWENDVVEIPTENGYSIIAWNNTEARWEMENALEEITTDFDNYWSYQVEVIGNIFDHPELLEGGVE